jgi:NACHT domain- and WD repeat-containing protein
MEASMAHTTRTFRIFVSSTFSDLIEERNALQKFVFPRLRDLCTQHACRFQAIDLRWGVREEAGLDQQTMRICLDEVSRSQRTSPKPNFIVLLGDRYGWRPLPDEIPARELEHIQRNTSDERDREILGTWYRRDDNACYKRNERSAPEVVYCLEPRGDRFADFQVWESEVERPLRVILIRGIGGLDLTEDERRKYEASATEQEIAAGALKIPDAKDHVFCFFREIKGLPADQSANDFVDLDDHANLDSEAVARLKRLKGEGPQAAGLLETRLPGNIHHYNANWTGSGITTDHIGALPERLEDCLRLLEAGSATVPPAPSGLCVDVWRRVARVILDEIARLEGIEVLEKEIADHAAFAEDRARLFVGRASILDTIADYVAGSDRHPLGVWGESGSGKSALIAKAVANCESRHANCALVSRFIGATPASSDGRSLLESLCRQVTRIYGGDEATNPTDYRELVKEFGERLKQATAQRPLVMFLDAPDQLSDADRARNLIWLPAELPEHVRLVVSTLTGECKTALERRLPASSLVKLEPMPTEEANELLEAWLTEAGRTLQPPQRDEVLTRFALSAMTADESGGDGKERRGMPLYLKLAFEEARRWKSYTPVVDLKPDIPGIIRQLFGRLSSDANHGDVVVSRSLGYLAASKNGLSEDEMLDLLSSDVDVRADFKARAKHTPPEERLPVIVWSRLYFDLEPYLTERSADGASLLSFYHRQLREVAEADLLSGDNECARHAHLASYFAHQDLFEPQTRTPNVRKLSELPYQQTYGEKWDELYATLTDFDFLEAKLTHVAVITSGKGEAAKTIYGGVYELQEDYRRALEKFPAE